MVFELERGIAVLGQVSRDRGGVKERDGHVTAAAKHSESSHGEVS